MNKKTIKIAEIMTGKLIGFTGNGVMGFNQLQIKTENGHYITIVPAKGYMKLIAGTIPNETEVEVDYTK